MQKTDNKIAYAIKLTKKLNREGFCAIIGGETKSGGQVYIQGYTI